MTHAPTQETVLQKLERLATAEPDRPAVEHGDDVLSYGELWARSKDVAASLVERGEVEPEPVAALARARGCGYVVGLVGILRAGWTCLPLDVKTPEEYNAALLDRARARVLVSDSSVPDSFMRGMARLGPATSDPPMPSVTVAQRACLFFTSGSTGKPKGVEVLHRGIAQLVRDRSIVPLGASDRIAQMASVAFDGSTFEIWGALHNGGTIVVPPRWPVAPREFAAFVVDRGITTLVITAAFFTLLMRDAPEAFDRLRMIIVGGDVVPLPAVRDVMTRCPELIVVNGYGPTEDTTISCQHRVVPFDVEQRQRIPIGRPIAGSSVAVLDASDRPVAPGTPGELCIAGEGLARGYLNNPEETAARFREVETEGRRRRYYSTGDLVVDTGDGVLEFLGRRDSQVKIRGHRIELRAVEHAMLEHDHVAAAAVIVAGDTAADKVLCAVVVPQPGEEDPKFANGVRRYLRQHWPASYVPARMEVLDALPMTRNGKVDLASLRELFS